MTTPQEYSLITSKVYDTDRVKKGSKAFRTGYVFYEDDVKKTGQKYKISQPELIHRWVNAYQTFGVQGLQRKRQNKAYSRQFKLNAVNLYLTSEKSYREIANEHGSCTCFIQKTPKRVLFYQSKL